MFNELNGSILLVPTEFQTIQSAINYSINNDTLLVSNGVYSERVRIVNKHLTIMGQSFYSGDTILNDLVTIRLPDSLRTDTSDQRSVLRITNSYISLKGLAICSGLGSGFRNEFNFYSIMGGGIFADTSTLDLECVIIRHCSAESGGGIGAKYSSLYLNNVKIDSCEGFSNQNAGAAIYVSNADTIHISNSSFCNNIHSYAVGGVYLHCQYGELINNLFHNNSGIVNVGAGLLSEGFRLISGNTISGNSSRNYAGLTISHNFEYTWVTRVISNVFVNNYLLESGESAGLSVITRTNNNIQILYNRFISNYSLGLIAGTSLTLQRGIYLIRNNNFSNNLATFGSVIGARQGARIFLDSNVVSRNTGTSIIYLLLPSICFASNNDYYENTGSILNVSNSNSTFMNNFWGHPSGPRTASNPGGQGDSLPDGIPYIPFRTTPVFPELDVRDFGEYEDGSGRSQYGSGLPNTITIENVYPNPSNSTLTVHYTLSRPQLIIIRLYDTNGRELYASLSQPQIAGSHTFSLQTDGIASGLCFLKLSSTTSPTESAMQKVVLLK